jgi:hypothetical protein
MVSVALSALTSFETGIGICEKARVKEVANGLQNFILLAHEQSQDSS